MHLFVHLAMLDIQEIFVIHAIQELDITLQIIVHSHVRFARAPWHIVPRVLLLPPVRYAAQDIQDRHAILAIRAIFKLMQDLQSFAKDVR